jgi:hypothetical protein
MTKRVLSTTTLTTRLEVAGEVTIDIGIVLSVPDGGLNQVRYSSTGPEYRPNRFLSGQKVIMLCQLPFDMKHS